MNTKTFTLTQVMTLYENSDNESKSTLLQIKNSKQLIRRIGELKEIKLFEVFLNLMLKGLILLTL